MRANVLSIPVLDQAKALAFYTDKLGFVKNKDIDMGGGHRWLTLLAKDWPEGPELLLEPAPLHFEPSKVYQAALKEAGIPCTQFEVSDLDAEYQRLKELGVEFKGEPQSMGTVKVALLDDTCGNFIQLVQNL